MTEHQDIYAFSQGLADAAETGGSSIAQVNARKRLPATGVLFAQSLLLTADHVVERDEDISVSFGDGSDIEATVAGRDPGSDLAVLKLASPVDGDVIRAAERARVGEIVLALGRPGGNVQASVGIITARGLAYRGRRRRRRHANVKRLSEPFLFTDAIPYPGFSGGPLINAAGEMVGLNTSGLVHGRSLAIPAARALAVAERLVEKGSIQKGYLGVRSQLTPLSEARQQPLGRAQEAGLLIVWVEDDSPAAKGGLQVGDILTAVGGEPVEDHVSLQAVLYSDLVGQPVEIEVLRGEARSMLMVTIGEGSA